MIELNVIDSLSIAESMLPDLIRLAKIKQKLAGFYYCVDYFPKTGEYLASVSDGPERFPGECCESEAAALESAFNRWKIAQK